MAALKARKKYGPGIFFSIPMYICIFSSFFIASLHLSAAPVEIGTACKSLGLVSSPFVNLAGLIYRSLVN